MRKTFILILAVLFVIPMSAQPTSQTGPRPYSPEYMKGIYDKREVRIPMRDGVELFTSIYEPKDRTVKHPIMMERTCYTVSPYGPDEFKNFAGFAPYVDAGYIFVFQDVRGKNMSGGEFDDIRPFIEGKKLNKKQEKNIGRTDEASDTYDTVEWLIHNTVNNGCVGQKGISYPGFYATMGALSGHPALKAVSPQAPVTDWFHGDDVHHNGAFMMAEMVSFQPFFEYMMSNRKAPVDMNKMENVDPESGFPKLFHTDLYEDYLRIGTFMNICRAYGDSISYFRILREHPDWDEYWESHTVTKEHMHDVKPAVMIVGGLFDKEDCYGAFDTYKAIKAQSPATDLYLVDGPWYHGAWDRGMKQVWGNIYFGDDATCDYYLNNIEYPFFAYYLEGKGEKPRIGAQVFDSGSRRWYRYDEGWPLTDVSRTTPYYLCADGTVSIDIPSSEGSVSYTSDPAEPVPFTSSISESVSYNYMIEDQRFADRRPDVISFRTEPLKDTLRLAGEIEVELTVDISSTDADFVVKVIDVFPDDFSWYTELGIEKPSRFRRRGPAAEIGNGVRLPDYVMGGYQFMVRGEVMRGKYRESFSEPEPFVPGEKTVVRFTMPDVSHSFMPGHSLMIQIQSSWFPLVDMNPQKFCNIYTCEESDYTKADVTIHCGGDTPSFVRLPVVK